MPTVSLLDGLRQTVTYFGDAEGVT
jgi:hypothetical protein